VLDDILGDNLNVVFCGTAVATKSAGRGHYHAGPGNEFWSLLYQAGFTPNHLGPGDDATLPSLGLGLTDLVKGVAQSHDRGLNFSTAQDLENRLALCRVKWVAFTSLKAGEEAARAFKEPKPRHGPQSWNVGDARVFVLPSPSGAARNAKAWDGRSTKLEWWKELADRL
jgi:TDG/mug DNA glycosylase family protein